jgi:hypothetical protein
MGRSVVAMVLIGCVMWLTRPRSRSSSEGLCGWPWLIAGVGLQVLWVRVLSMHATEASALVQWLPSIALFPAFRFLWLNRSYHGLWLLAVGAALNLLVMIDNGGLMPISPATLHAIGYAAPARHLHGAVMWSKDRVIGDGAAALAGLDDRIIWAMAGTHVACSIGDILVLMGCLVTVGEEVWRARRGENRSIGPPAISAHGLPQPVGRHGRWKIILAEQVSQGKTFWSR